MKLRLLSAKTALVAAGALLALPTMAQVSFDIDAGSRGTKIGDLHYGIFYEEINHAGDGGLYAELVRNRSFEDDGVAGAWAKSDGTTWEVVTSGLLNAAQKRALKVNFTAAGQYITNEGFWGMNCTEGKTYTLSFFAKSDKGYNGTLTAELTGDNGATLGSAPVAVSADGEWKKYTAVITAAASSPKASLRLVSDKACELTLDVVSLFPPTYKNRENGCRPDLAEMLEAMHPAFVRFPGGCYIEGTNRDGSYNRFEWKKTIGPIETRPGHMNVNWNYRVSDGLGFHELLQLTEDLGAEPLYVVNVGMGHGWTINYTDIDEYVQEALDAIEYCNGDVNTTWGAVRAANGHPEPFNLRLIEVGNENYQADASQQSDHYAERYRTFYDAIKARWPEMLVIGNVEAWGTDNPSWRNNHPVDAVDEHYYRNPSWFASNYAKYDSYDRNGPKVYAGEYAVTSDYGTTGHLRAALGEAIYMLGMENNSDICVMNSYAPIFVNENDQKWMPDMIRFNSSQSYGTPSYYVQQLFPNNVGKQNVRWTETGNTKNGGNKIGFSSWSTVVEYDNVKVSDTDGNVIFTETFNSAGNWQLPSGWRITGGVLKQSDSSSQGSIAVGPENTPDNFIFEFDARKTSGNEGFLVAFNYGGTGDYIWWNLGGWNNSAHAIEVARGGAKTQYDKTAGSIETGRTYHGKIVFVGGNLQCWLDNDLIHEIQLPVERKLYMSANIDDAAGILYCKIVNMGSEAQPVTLNITNGTFTGAEATVLKGDSEAENTTANPHNVVPADAAIALDGSRKATFEAPASSLTIIRFKVAGVTITGGQPMSPAALAEIKSSLGGLQNRLNHLRSHANLPTATADGATLEWSLGTNASPALELSSSMWTSRLDVTGEKGNTEVSAGTLVARVTDRNGNTGTIEFPVTLAPSDGMYGYLYTFMNASREITNYALGTREDKGRVFNHLLNGAEIFDTEALAGIEHGTRDAYMTRGERADEYFMTTTDMCNRISGVWNNFGMNLLRSTDMIHWQSETFDFRKGKRIFSDPEATTDLYRTDAEYANIRRVWAPQFIWDPDAFNGQGAYLVYYSVLSTNNGDNHDRIVYSYADRDFKTLTQPRIFFDPGYSVIDGDIVYNEYDGLYHLWLKHEGASGTDRGIYQLTSSKLVGEPWTEVNHMTNEGTELTEGSTTIRRIDEDDWNLYYMRYTGGSNYKVCDTDHQGTNISSSMNLEGTGAFQHGSMMTVTETEYNMLLAWDEITRLMDWAKGTGSALFSEALAQADAALAKTTVDELAVSLPEAIAAIKGAREAYMKNIIENAADGDITSLLQNPDFTDRGNGWSGTSFTAANSGVAEHWNKTYDTYQELPGMPAGYYTLSCSGFYRYGNATEGLAAHRNGTEQLLAKVYINTEESSFMSLYDESTNYTDSPYNFPDNVSQANAAFNTLGFYGGNAVEYHLEQPGTLRLGIRKSVAKGSDWNCFDNFRLHYSKDPSGVDSPAIADTEHVDVYSITGMKVLENVTPAEARRSLPAGFYIIGNQKIAIY